MLWELIRISQELLFLIVCSTGSEMKHFVHCEKFVARGFWCLTGFLCHHLACQKPTRFALQGQCERISRSWHSFWRYSHPFAMFMWDGDGWQEPERNLNGGSFSGRRQGQIPLVRLVRPSARGSISCAFIKMCSLTCMFEHKKRKPSKPSK